MEIPEASVFTVGITSELPSYTEAIRSPLPSTPPPSYVEAVGVPSLQLDNAASPYPILYIPPAATPVQLTQQLAVQPSPHHVIPQQQGVGTLGDAPTVIICPHCCSLITTKVQNKPGSAAWALCCLLAFLG
ncbi:lipopolysaccharide-induced tumor necrosis factor-alpha factor, partial [Clarias magur]